MSRASSTVLGRGFARRLADVAAIGPTTPITSSRKSSVGSRSCTVPRVSPRSQVSDSPCLKISVSGPGQYEAISRSAQSGTSITRPLTWRWLRISTGSGTARLRRRAPKMRCVAVALNASAATA